MRSLSCSALLLLGACSKQPPPPPVPAQVVVADTIVLVDTVEVEVGAEETAELRQQVNRLRIRLFERDAQIRQVQTQLGDERQEVVRNMAKLQGQATRAEAASEMAEAQLAVQALSGSSSAGTEKASATQLLAESAIEFNRGNYGGAVYLATQARTKANMAKSLLSATRGRAELAGESTFSIPVPLKARGTSNVREGPGTSNPVLFVAAEGSSLTGLSYTSDWLFVRDVRGQEGWIHHTLVQAR